MESKGTTVVASCIHQALTDSHRYTTLTDATFKTLMGWGSISSSVMVLSSGILILVLMLLLLVMLRYLPVMDGQPGGWDTHWVVSSCYWFQSD